MKLFRPVGMFELALIYDSSMAVYPPRLPEQPIFYPVLNFAYAEQIARDWNTKSTPYAGYVTQFEIEEDYIASFDRKIVGNKIHEELWVPADELDKFNKHINPPIEVVSAYFGSKFEGYPQEKWEGDPNANEQLIMLEGSYAYNGMDVSIWIAENHKTVYLNYPYWECCDISKLYITEEKRQKVLEMIQRHWDMQQRIIPLITYSEYNP